MIAYLTGVEKPQMPFGQTPLSAAQIDLFRGWIRDGAKDDTPAEARSIVEPGKPVAYHAAPVITALRSARRMAATPRGRPGRGVARGPAAQDAPLAGTALDGGRDRL